MRGLGTILNVAGILLGGTVGVLFGKRVRPQMQKTLLQAVGICVMFLGIAGCMEEMFAVTQDGLQSGGTMMMIASFAIGALLGEWLDLEDKIERFGAYLKRKSGSEDDASFVSGFVTASMTVCIGAMAVVGAIEDGLSGDYSVLLAKAVLDMIIIAVMAASMGKGCLFSALPVAILQGLITLIAVWLEPIMTEQALSNLSLTGSVLIFCVGANLIWEKKFRAANLLPAIVVAVLYSLIP
ncbi:MAG: DUF554 domain-containing protein [Oscillospiraceae bacterium]|nr:DUF554 domain-containing protein [Oscillospiraceae bacterium]